MVSARRPLTAYEQEQANRTAYRKFAPPNFIALHPGNPLDEMNPPLSARAKDMLLPKSLVSDVQPMRARCVSHANSASSPLSIHDRCALSRVCSFTISDAALSRLLAPSGGKGRGSSSNQPLVDELTHIARTRLSSADVLQLRDQLTSILEGHSGAPGAAVTAVRASRGFEAQLKAEKPVSVREFCLAFPMWPFAVQAHFFKQLLRLARLPFTPDDEDTDRPPLPAPGGQGGQAPTPISDPSSLGRDFAGLQGIRSTMLQPIGLALPALRTSRGAPGAIAVPETTAAPNPSESGSPTEQRPPSGMTPRGSKGSTQVPGRSPRLVVMSRS